MYSGVHSITKQDSDFEQRKIRAICENQCGFVDTFISFSSTGASLFLALYGKVKHIPGCAGISPQRTFLCQRENLEVIRQTPEPEENGVQQKGDRS